MRKRTESELKIDNRMNELMLNVDDVVPKTEP